MAPDTRGATSKKRAPSLSSNDPDQDQSTEESPTKKLKPNSTGPPSPISESSGDVAPIQGSSSSTPVPTPDAISVVRANNGVGARLVLTSNNDKKIDSLTRSYLTEPFLTRFNRLLNYSSDVNQVYSLRCLPLDRADWGPKKKDAHPDVDPSSFLHVDGKLITVWILGELKIFKTREKIRGTNQVVNARRPMVGVQPFHASDAVLASEILGDLRVPKSKPNDKASLIWATCWNAGFGVSDGEVPQFHECYDAREKWLGMQFSQNLTLSPGRFGSPDVVLVEAKIRRRAGDADKWFVEFELDCVALLHSAPRERLVKNIVAFEA